MADLKKYGNKNSGGDLVVLARKVAYEEEGLKNYGFPDNAPVNDQGIYWHNPEGTGDDLNKVVSGWEGAWTTRPKKMG